ncbi:MAG: TolB-like protein [Polaribacter sp.]|jgi:TolB-like protein
MKYYSVPILLTLVMQGCSSSGFHSDHYPSRFSQYGYGYEFKQNPLNAESINTTTSSKMLKKYADRIAMSLLEQVDINNISQMGVASFVDMDDNLKSAHALGNKLAEALIISLHEVGFNIIELNLSNNTEITDKGNFIFDRRQQNKQNLPFMVAGIINYTQSGININSRLVQTDTANILAANSLFMPNFVLKSAFPTVDGSNLVIKTQ